MKKTIALLLQHPPYGTSRGREGLEAAQLLAALEHEILLCFIGDGVWQLTTNQQSETGFLKVYTKAIKSLNLYEIDRPYVLEQDLDVRGLSAHQLMIPVHCVTPSILSSRIAQCDFSVVL